MQTAWLCPVGKYRNRSMQIYFYLVCETMTNVVLFNSMAWPMKLRSCVFNKVFLVNHWHDIRNCNCKWSCLSNSYRCIGPKS